MWITEKSHYNTCQEELAKDSFTRNVHQFRASVATPGVWGPIVKDQRSMKQVSNAKIFFPMKLNKGISSINIHFMKLPMILHVFLKF